MGNVTFGVPEDLALALKKALNCNCFIETGTYKGNTALWAGKNFLKVHTIEFDEDRYRKTLARISNTIDGSNIKMWQGNSKYVLPEILKDIDEPVIFWLDAHGTFVLEKPQTEDDEIPVIDELNAICKWYERTHQPCVILIDDARLFINPPPVDKGYHPEYWPNQYQLDDAFVYFEMAIAKDVIVLYDSNLRDIVYEWIDK